MARELALTMAGAGNATLLVNMDITRCDQYVRFASAEGQAAYGAITGPYDACYGASPFWHVSPVLAGAGAQAGFGALYQCRSRNLSLTTFSWQAVKDGQSVQIARAPDYWQVLRGHYNAVIIDVPASDRSGSGETVFGYADACVLVTSASSAPDNHVALSAIAAAGGTCAGAIINQVPPHLAQTGALL